MTPAQQRQTLLPLIEQAQQGGARLRKACAQIGLSARTAPCVRLVVASKDFSFRSIDNNEP